MFMFVTGVMRSGKSAQLLDLVEEFASTCQDEATFTAEPGEDDAAEVSSRDGRVYPARRVYPNTTFHVDPKRTEKCNVIIDEAQFLTPEQVLQLVEAENTGVYNIYAFGLTLAFDGSVFPGAAALNAWAHRKWTLNAPHVSCNVRRCPEVPVLNGRVSEGALLREGPQVQVGGDDTYVPLCRTHWLKGEFE